MASQMRRNIGHGWTEMQDVKGRIYYANKVTKQTSWVRPQLHDGPAEDFKAPRKSQKGNNYDHQRQHSDPSELTLAPVPSSGDVQLSGQGRVQIHATTGITGTTGATNAGRKSQKSNAAHPQSSTVSDLSGELRRRTNRHQKPAVLVETELESAPFHATATGDDDSFVEDVPTSFAVKRNTAAPAKSLALMLEDALSTHLDDASDHQVAAIRHYFQELDHVSVRPVQDPVDNHAPIKSEVHLSLQQPLLDGKVEFTATPRESVPAHKTANSAFNIQNNVGTSSSQHVAPVSFHSPTSNHRVVRDVCISGATGLFADIVNGVYEPTSEHCCGMTVYRKREDNDKWLEYSNAADRWSVLDTAHRGQVWGWAFLTTHRNIEKCKGLSGWKIAEGPRFVDDLNICVDIIERSVSKIDANFEHDLLTHLVKSSITLSDKSSFPIVPLDSISSVRSDLSMVKASIHHDSSSSKSFPVSPGLSIIEQLERTLVKQPVVSEERHPLTQNELHATSIEWYHRNTWAVVRLQALFRGIRDRKSVRQKRMCALVKDLAAIQAHEAAGHHRHFDEADAVVIEPTNSSETPSARTNSGQGRNHRASADHGSANPESPVSSAFHPLHFSSSKNRSVIDAIVQRGVQSDDIDPNELLLVLKKSKLFKNRKVGEKFVPNASICCELVDFAVITFKLDSRDQAVVIFQKLVDSKHLELPQSSQFFKDEHAFVLFPQHENDTKTRHNNSLYMNSDFAVVVESIWRDNNLRIACGIVSDVMNSREPRQFYEGWRSNLHDIAFNKGLRALMFIFLLAHVGLGFYMTRELNWKGDCRNHPSELTRVSDTLYVESSICSLYVMYASIRAIAGFPKSLRRWFIFEIGLIIAMWADVGFSLGTKDGYSAPVRFSLPLRPLMIACWSNRLRTHLHEIYLSVRKLKVLGGAVLLWIIISATLCTIYVRIVCTSQTDQICSQLTSLYFDNAATAMVTLAIMMTTSNYGTISQMFLNRPNQSTTGIILIFAGLIIYMIVSYFLLLSMMLAIVFDAFKKGKRQIMSEKSDVFDAALIGAFSLLCERDSMSIKHDTYRRFMRMLIPNISADRIRKYWEFLDADKSGSIDLEEFLELSTIASFQVHSVSLTRIKLMRFFTSLGRFGTGLSFFNDFITSKYFVYVSEGVVVANILVVFVSNVLDAPPENYVHPMLGYDSSSRLCQSLASQESKSSCQGQIVLDIIEFSFFLFYSLELILRWLAKGLQWIIDPWILFDSVIVFLATASYIILISFESNAIDPSISVVFRMLRIVRIIRLFKMSPNLNAFIVTISSIIPGVLSFLCLVLIFVNSFAGLGMLIFQCIDVNPEVSISNNVADFDTMTGSFIVLFQVLVTADWDSFLWQIRLIKPNYFVGGAVYFLSFYIFVVLLLTNILVSLIIESYGVNLDIIRSGLVNDVVQTQDEGLLLMRYNQSKVIDAKIASFDRQTHRQSSQTFQSHKNSLKLMKMKSKPSANSSVTDSPGKSHIRERVRSGTLVATRSKRSLTVSENRTPESLLNSLLPYPKDEPPPLVLNAGHAVASQPQNVNLHETPPSPSIMGQSQPRVGSIDVPKLVLQNPTFEPQLLASSNAYRQRSISASDIYSARWKISAADILQLLQRDSGLIKDVKHRFSVHKSVIVGSELVSYFVTTRICSTREDAVDLGQHLVMDDILEHEYQEHVFKDKYLFYRILPRAAHNAAKIGAGSDDSDFDDDVDFIGLEQHEASTPISKIASPGHSALARHLMRKMSSIGSDNDAYLNDSALQDDAVAEAAADRYLADDYPSSSTIELQMVNGANRDSVDDDFENLEESRDFESENGSLGRVSADGASSRVSGDDSDEEFNHIIAASAAITRAKHAASMSNG